MDSNHQLHCPRNDAGTSGVSATTGAPFPEKTHCKKLRTDLARYGDARYETWPECHEIDYEASGHEFSCDCGDYHNALSPPTVSLESGC